ncbi:condensation domain-containing protein [Virgibacillus pantothenticus]|uniref:condensation domain-containing protein n=1 Tax=Virgibacillus pantothenticus TaxID=1473 RepID=UPI0009855F6D|nr:condensation domain-containing protein [Virgibacillus pantothenticus]
MHAFGKGEEFKTHYPYSNYVEFENEFYQSKEYKKMGNYWLEKFTDFNFSNPLKIREDLDGTSHSTVLMDNELADNLVKFAKQNGTTLYNLMLSAYNIAISHFTGREDIAVVTPVLNRYLPEFKNCIGVFTNLVPLRNKIVKDLIISEFIGNVTKVTKDGLKNQFYQYNHLIEDLKKYEPQFLYYMDFEDKSLKKHRTTEDIPHSVNIPKFCIDLEVKNLNDTYNVTASYKEKYFNEFEISYILDSFFKILESIINGENSDKKIKQITVSLNVPSS